MAKQLTVYKKDGTKVASGNATTVSITGLTGGTAVKAGDYQVSYVDGDKESEKVDVPAFTVKTVAVSGVTLDKTTASVAVGANVTLKATVAPSNATNKAVTWTTSAAATATVDTAGKVVGVAAGEATITAKAGDKTATCKVTVTAAEG